MVKKKWFKEAVEEKKPYSLGGWSKGQSASVRRRRALDSRPRNWSLKRRYLSSSRALQSLANVTRDKQTKLKAGADANYFLKKYYASR